VVLLTWSSGDWASETNARDFFKSSEQLSFANAAAEGRVDELENLTRHGANVNATGIDGMTALYWALDRSSKQGVSWLLEHGADPNAIFARDGTSATSLAAMHEDSWYLKEILAHGGDPNFRNPLNKNTPLFDALAAHRDNNVRVLITAGADMNTLNSIGATPMFVAAANQRYELVYDMLKAGADPTVKIGKSGKTVLSVIRRSRVPPGAPPYEWQLKVVDFLRQKGLDVERSD
jgi:ankyrin repeat protein